jgi:peptidylprolyl isomerase
MSDLTDLRRSAESAATAQRRRGQAILGAIGGVAVVLVLVLVFVIVKVTGDDKPSTQAAAAAPAPSAAAAQPTAAPPSEAPSAPAASEPAAPKSVNTPAALKDKPVVKAGTGTVSALKVTYLVKGKGPKVTSGEAVTTNYVLVAYKTGQVLDNSWDRGQVFTYQSGAGDIIQGWDKGLNGVPVGSRVQLDVPADLAYGPQQGDLRFVVDVLAATKG